MGRTAIGADAVVDGRRSGGRGRADDSAQLDHDETTAGRAPQPRGPFSLATPRGASRRIAKIVPMRWKLWLILAVQAALVVLLAVAVRTGLMPLGIRGEWQWMRLADGAKPPWDWFALAAAGVAAYAAVVGLGWRAL